MVIKKQVMDDILKRFNGDLAKIHQELNQNRQAINKLVDRQKVLKKEVKMFYGLLRSLPKGV